jgi:protein-S-isoprenylcysteine O-methyltransferase Ste14
MPITGWRTNFTTRNKGQHEESSCVSRMRQRRTNENRLGAVSLFVADEHGADLGNIGGVTPPRAPDAGDEEYRGLLHLRPGVGGAMHGALWLPVRCRALRAPLTIAADRVRAVRGFFRSTPNRTFLTYPVIVVIWQAVETRGRLNANPWGLGLMAWGYLQFRLVGRYRQRHGTGTRGFGGGNMPDRLLQHGPFAFTRNPMYLGHLIFLWGLVSAFHSALARIVFAANTVWFPRRVLKDEELPGRTFGWDYRDYVSRVKRWVPFVY